MTLEEQIMEEVQGWGKYDSRAFVQRVRSLRALHPRWWMQVDFRYHLDIELRLRELREP